MPGGQCVFSRVSSLRWFRSPVAAPLPPQRPCRWRLPRSESGSERCVGRKGRASRGTRACGIRGVIGRESEALRGFASRKRARDGVRKPCSGLRKRAPVHSRWRRRILRSPWIFPTSRGGRRSRRPPAHEPAPLLRPAAGASGRPSPRGGMTGPPPTAGRRDATRPSTALAALRRGSGCSATGPPAHGRCGYGRGRRRPRDRRTGACGAVARSGCPPGATGERGRPAPP